MTSIVLQLCIPPDFFNFLKNNSESPCATELYLTTLRFWHTVWSQWHVVSPHFSMFNSFLRHCQKTESQVSWLNRNQVFLMFSQDLLIKTKTETLWTQPFTKTQDVNWTCIRRSLNVLRTFSLRPVSTGFWVLLVSTCTWKCSVVKITLASTTLFSFISNAFFQVSLSVV